MRRNIMATVTSVSYFKRYKMEMELHSMPSPRLPDEFAFVAWSCELLGAHADMLFGSFHQEIDAQVFPSLGDRQGALCLMIEMTRKRGFLPEATWLLLGPLGPCGTVQGLCERFKISAFCQAGVAAVWGRRCCCKRYMAFARPDFAAPCWK